MSTSQNCREESVPHSLSVGPLFREHSPFKYLKGDLGKCVLEDLRVAETGEPVCGRFREA